MAWNESVYFGDSENLFDFPGISTKAGITTADATPSCKLSMGEDRSGSVCIWKGKLSDYLWLLQQFPKVCKLKSTSSDSVIKAMKYVFSNLGICKECFSDNGLQFSSKEFKEFVNKYQFKHTTSSPKYPQSYGLIESSVKIVKNLLKKSKSDGSDFYLNLLVYRS